MINQREFVMRIFLMLIVLFSLNEINSSEGNDSDNPLAEAYCIAKTAANGCLHDSDRDMLQQQFSEINLDEFKIPEISTLSVETFENACRTSKRLRDVMRNLGIATTEQVMPKKELLNLLNKVRDLAQQANSDLITKYQRLVLREEVWSLFDQIGIPHHHRKDELLDLDEIFAQETNFALQQEVWSRLNRTGIIHNHAYDLLDPDEINDRLDLLGIPRDLPEIHLDTQESASRAFKTISELIENLSAKDLP